MDKKKAAKLERHLEKAIIEVICRLGLKNLPLLPAHRTMKEMAKAAVGVYEKSACVAAGGGCRPRSTARPFASAFPSSASPPRNRSGCDP